jgi:hypothetical protein
VLFQASKNSNSFFQSIKAAVGFGDQLAESESAPAQPQGSLTERLHQMIADLDAGEQLAEERLQEALKKAS